MKKTLVPSLTPQRYAETFAVFVEHSLEYPLMLDKLSSCTNEKLKQGFNILDIGAGTGHMLKEWMSRIDFKPSHYTAFEPNESHFKDLAASVTQLNIENTLYNSSFTADTALPEKYDIVLFSHSLYWMPDPALTMQHASKLITENGIVLAFIGGPYGVHAMFPLFEPYIERTSPMLQNNAISSHEVIIGLRQYGIEPEITLLPSPIDITGLFEVDARPQLAEFISFCMQIEFNSLPSWLQTDIIQYVHGGSVEQGDKLYWYLPTAAIIINARNSQ